MYELILLVTLQYAATTTYAPTTFYGQAQQCELIGGRPFNCLPIPHVTVARKVDTFATYGECMKRVARIGESDEFRAICRKREVSK